MSKKKTTADHFKDKIWIVSGRTSGLGCGVKTGGPGAIYSNGRSCQ
jgi:hypothetical protein